MRCCAAMRSTILALAVALCLVAETALGASLEIIGDPGDPGAAGLPGQNGGTGEGGAAVDSTLANGDPENIVTGYGGNGGAGGDGGSAPLSGSAPGNGGDGGAGGSSRAHAEATGTTFVGAAATAVGGNGGAGGAAGAPDSGPSGLSGIGGDGGAAESIASASAEGRVVAVSFAEGGAGGTGRIGGNGGDADARASTDGETDFRYSLATADGGDGGDGGNASTPDGRGGAGGRATGSSRATSAIGQDVVAIVRATGGTGGRGALAGAGGDAVVRNSTSGSTAGRLDLGQYANGGKSASAGGFAVSELYTENPDGGDIRLWSIASGGDLLQDSAPDASPGGAHASGIAIDGSGSSIQINAGASQGIGWYASSGEPGAASLGRVYGQSTAGGDVTVHGYLVAETVDLVNAVDGDTSGDLSLSQWAQSASVRNGVPRSARSIVRKTSSARSLDVESDADGGSNYDEESAHIDGGSADAVAEAEGSGEIVRALANAEGGSVYFDLPPDRGRGGDSSATAIARSTGDAVFTSAYSAAVAESGGDASSRSDAVAERQGSVVAVSEATGVESSASARAVGSGTVAIESYARAAGGICDVTGCGSGTARAEARGARVAAAQSYASGAAFEATSLAASQASVRAVRARSIGRNEVATEYTELFAAEAIAAIHAEPGFSWRANWRHQAVALGHPDPADVESWLSAPSEAAEAVDVASEVLGLAKLGAGARSPDFSGEVEFSFDRSALAEQDGVFLAFLAPDAIAGGFETLDLSVAIDGVEILDLQWSDLASADEFFGETVIEIPVGDSVVDPLLDVLISMRIVLGDEEQEFFADFALFSAEPVPEPALAVLVVAALFAVVLQRRTRAAILRR